jgi:FkbH-like protein
MSAQNIVIASNFTSEPLKNSLEFLLNEHQVSHEINFAPFRQIFQELLAPSSLFHKNLRGANVVLFRSEDFVETEIFTHEVLENIKNNVLELQSILKNAAVFQVPLITIICPPSNKIAEDKFAADFIKRVETSFVKDLENTSNLLIFSAEDFSQIYEVSEYDNPKANLYGRIPYTTEFFAALGAFLARKICACAREPHKVIVLDCDNTIWTGIVGEDGVDGIEFDEPRMALQKFMAAQSEAGMLICLCSKNNEPEVWKVFDSRQEMILKREHIVASQINWNFKSENLKHLADELQLSLNSFIFVDDDAAVCAEVAANCSEVLTLMLPQNTKEIPAFLQHVWAFDKLKTTKEDKDRTKSYQQQVERTRLQESSTNFQDFLANLQLKCEIARINEAQIPRVSQLSLRTNQFNSTTKRRSENDVKQLFSQSNAHIWTINVQDRFGDYGLVGAIFGEEKEQSLNVDSLMLSCRALGRGIEHKMLAALGCAAIDSNCKFVNLEFVASAKNTPVHNFLEEVGKEFKEETDNQTFYKFPAEIAVNIEFNPTQKTSVPKVESKNGSRIEQKATDNFSERNAVIVKIANHFRTAEQILSAIKAVENNRSIVQKNFIAPRNETEQKLSEIWQRTLNLSVIGITDNFFEIGGDSLQAVSLFVEIEDAFDKHLPLTVLIDSPTIEKMAEQLSTQESADKLKYLVPIKPEGSETPLFCMHAAGGNVLFYRDLANELNAEQPVYGLQARGIADKSETAHENVAEMAAEYLKEIRTIQPSGAYRLCGSSFGGLIAFEMAYQLAANGEEVSLLALFDTYAPGYPQKKPDSFPFESKFRNFVEKAGRLREQIGLIETPREKLDFFKKQFQKLRVRSKRKKAWKENQFDIEYAKATGRELPVNVRRNHLAIQHALDSYAPPLFDGKMTLFRAALQPSGVIFEPTLGWKKFTTREIIIKEVSGSHGALTVHPYAKHLAKELSPLLKERKILTNTAAKFAVV